MTTPNARLPEDTAQRLKQLAASRGLSLTKLMEELGTSALAVRDAEPPFQALALAAGEDHFGAWLVTRGPRLSADFQLEF